jgi:anti-sigma regulatory factor (Ser/Thr protein kinase)
MTASKTAEPISLPLDPGAARLRIRDILDDGAWVGDADDVVLATHEALVNARRHGGAAVRADLAINGSSLVVRVWDAGPGFDLADRVRRAPDPTSERGRGLWLIDRMTTACEVDRDDDGVVLVMRFDRPD